MSMNSLNGLNGISSKHVEPKSPEPTTENKIGTIGFNSSEPVKVPERRIEGVDNRGNISNDMWNWIHGNYDTNNVLDVKTREDGTVELKCAQPAADGDGFWRYKCIIKPRENNTIETIEDCGSIYRIFNVEYESGKVNRIDHFDKIYDEKGNYVADSYIGSTCYDKKNGKTLEYPMGPSTIFDTPHPRHDYVNKSLGPVGGGGWLDEMISRYKK